MSASVRSLGIAAPVQNYLLPVVLCLVGPEGRIQPKLKDFVKEVKAAAGRISHNITGIFDGKGGQVREGEKTPVSLRNA